MVRAKAVRVVFDTFWTKISFLDIIQNCFWVIAQFNTQVIDELNLPTLVDLGIKRHLCERGSTMDQRAAGVVAHTAKD